MEKNKSSAFITFASTVIMGLIFFLLGFFGRKDSGVSIDTGMVTNVLGIILFGLLAVGVIAALVLIVVSLFARNSGDKEIWTTILVRSCAGLVCFAAMFVVFKYILPGIGA